MSKFIYEEACDVLFFTGVKCPHPEIRRIFVDHSCEMALFDETTGRIHIPRDLISFCLEVTPRRSRLPIEAKSFGYGGTPAFWKQGDDPIEPVLDIHNADAFRLAQEFKMPFLFNPCGKNYRYVDARKIDVMRQYYDGYIFVTVQTDAGIERAVQDMEETGKICAAHDIMFSPLAFYGENNPDVDSFLTCLEKGLPVCSITMPISSSTAPATRYGLAVQGLAEFLVALCLVQLKRPGSIIVNAGFPAAGDPRDHYQPAYGSMFHNLCNFDMAHLMYLLDLPSVQSGCTIKYGHKPMEGSTDYQTFMGFLIWNLLSEKGAGPIRHCFGIEGKFADFNINKARRDLVALDYVISQGLKYEGPLKTEMNYDEGAFDAISQGAEIGSFRDLSHTTRKMGLLDEYLNPILPEKGGFHD